MGLHRACTQGRPAEVRRLIQDGRDVNVYDKSGWTPLLRAAYHGHVDVARELIRANADVHLKVRSSGRTVPHIATYYIYQVWLKFVSLLMMVILRMDEQAARDMVRAKADNYWKIKGSGRTALHVAAYYGHQAMVKLFLETNININDQDDEGRTTLMLAVERGRSAVVAELVKAGADISLKDKKGMTAVLLAKSYDMVHQLVKDVDHLSREDRSRILWHACDVGDLSTVQSVIEVGCDVDHIHKGQTPVMMATLRGHDSIVKELILANCDVNFKAQIIFGDLAIPLNYDRVARAKVSNWIVAIFCALLPCQWMKFHMDVVATLWGYLMLLAIVFALAIVRVLRMSGSSIVMLLEFGMAGFVVVMVARVVMVVGPIVVFIMAIPLVSWKRKASDSVLTVVIEVLGNAVSVLAGLGTVVIMMSVMRVIFGWSPQFMWMTRTEVAAGVFTIMAALVLLNVLLKQLMPTWSGFVLMVLEGVILTVEVFVIASSWIMLGRKTLLFHESPTALRMLELVMTVALFILFLLMVLRTRATDMALWRGVLGFAAFGATKLPKMEDALLLLDIELLHVLVGLAVFIILVGLSTAITKQSTLLKGVVLVLHLVVAVIEVYLAVIISKQGPELQIGTVSMEEFVNLTLVLVLVLSFQAPNDTALHHAAAHNRTDCGVLLVEAGAYVLAIDRLCFNPLEMGSRIFVDKVKEVLSVKTKRVIAVIGNTEHGKSTLVAALECTSNILWKKAINRFKKVRDIRQRTAGIEAVQVSNQKYGEALFYDFAGQSQYHGPHQSFLEAMMSKPEVSVTLLLLVKATEEEDAITQQLHRWLQPLSLMSTPSTPKVMVVGSFFDQVKSKKEASEKLLRCTQSVKTELCLNIQGPCLLDCRQPESKGINQICSFLQEAHPVITGALSYNLHWVLVQVRKAFSIPTLPLYKFQTWLQHDAANLPRNLPSPEEVCQDLSAAGHTLFLPNKQDPSQSWLILDLPALLHNVYGTLFSGSRGTDNQFGLLHYRKLNELFPELVPEVIQEVLKSLEFCIEVDPLLLKEELSRLTVDKGEGWLYFPALVSAKPHHSFPEDPNPDQPQWMCWQLRTPEKHIISAHLLQTIILRLAAKHVFIQEPSPGVRQHCCRVWINGISWSSTKGVDIAVQISDNSVVQVVGRSKAGPQRLQEYTTAIVQDVTKAIAQLSPKLEATSYIVHPYTPTLCEEPKAPQAKLLYLVSAINCCISDGEDHIPSMSLSTSSIPIDQLFGGELPSLGTVQGLNYRSVVQNGSSEAPLTPLLSAPSLDELNQLVVWRVAAHWYEVGVFLEVGAAVLDSIRADSPHSVRQACRDMFREWLSRGPGTGGQPRVWLSVLEAVKETVGETVAEEVKRILPLQPRKYQEM